MDGSWTELDTAYAVALTALEAVTCSGCGQDRRQSMDAANEFAYTVEPLRCYGCAAQHRAGEKFKGDDASRAGLMFSVKKKEVGK